jgi:LysM repeat protein
MTRLGRIVVTVVVAAVLVGLTALAAHWLSGPDEAEPAGSGQAGAGAPPETVETPTTAAAGGGETAGDDQEASADSGDTTSAAGQAVVSSGAGAAGAETAGTGSASATAGGAGSETTAAGGRAATPAAATGAEEAKAALAMLEDRPIVAQRRLSGAVKAGVSGPLAVRVNEAVRQLADRLQLSKNCHAQDPYSKTYAVQSGDTLSGIGKRFLVPYPLVMKLNGLETSAIRAGQALKVIQGPVHVEVLKSRFELRAWLGDVCLRVYPVGVGTNNSTPEGTFNVKNKITNPPYQPQHKPVSEHRAAGAADNPLGTRWIDIGNHYGIHGTIEPDSIGRDVSEGCIRMHNRHVEELFDLVVMGATKVIVRP